MRLLNDFEIYLIVILIKLVNLDSSLAVLGWIIIRLRVEVNLHLEVIQENLLLFSNGDGRLPLYFLDFIHADEGAIFSYFYLSQIF